MNLNEKKELVKSVETKFKSSLAFFISHNNGLKANEISTLRKELKASDAELNVVKNTITRLAIQSFNYDEKIKNELKGPSTVTFSYGDPVLAAKALLKVVKSTKRFSIASGLLGNRVLSSEDIDALALLPSKEELIAKTVRTVAAPLSSFMTVLSGVPRNFMNVLEAIKEQKDN